MLNVRGDTPTAAAQSFNATEDEITGTEERRDQLERAGGQQPGGAWTRADEVDGAGAHAVIASARARCLVAKPLTAAVRSAVSAAPSSSATGD